MMVLQFLFPQCSKWHRDDPQVAVWKAQGGRKKKKTKWSHVINRLIRHTDFFLKTIAWLAQEEALVSLTPKEPAFHPFVPNPSQEQALVFFQVLFLPLLTLFLGLSVWKRRRSL
jgi:hypothetical protein